jgi:serine/threonine protein kinase
VTIGAGLHLLRQIAVGVAVLHREGVVHCDLAPGTILSVRPGRVSRESFDM